MNPLDQITTLADELTEPHAHREPYTVWDDNRHRKTHHHITVQHGLLTQLYRAVLPTSMADNNAGGSIPDSRPPLEVEALSRHTEITKAARAWCKTLGIERRPTAESTIRALIGAAPTLADQQLHDLHHDLRRWVHWCRVYLGLEQVRRITGSRCPIPDCNILGSLRINLTTSHGLCTACGATWDRDTIGLLAEHITSNRKAQHV